MPVDYSKTKIYTIRSPHTDKLYVGATTKHYLSKRMVGHRSQYNHFLKGKTKSCPTSRFILECGEAYIQLEEKFPCSCIEESNKKEREYIEKYGEKCVNIIKPGRKKKEYREDNKERIALRCKKYRENNKEIINVRKKEYYEDNKERTALRCKKYRENNKEQVLARKKEYYEKNKERIIAQKKEHFTCPYCSRTIARRQKPYHFRSKICQKAREAREAEEEIEIIFED